jgi:hypothetical protein
VIALPIFDEVLARIGLGLGHPEMNRFRHEMLNGRTPSELEGIVGRAIGPSGLMEFARHDLGAVIRKEGGSAIPKSVRLICTRLRNAPFLLLSICDGLCL